MLAEQERCSSLSPDSIPGSYVQGGFSFDLTAIILSTIIGIVNPYPERILNPAPLSNVVRQPVANVEPLCLSRDTMSIVYVRLSCHYVSTR